MRSLPLGPRSCPAAPAGRRTRFPRQRDLPHALHPRRGGHPCGRAASPALLRYASLRVARFRAFHASSHGTAATSPATPGGGRRPSPPATAARRGPRHRSRWAAAGGSSRRIPGRLRFSTAEVSFSAMLSIQTRRDLIRLNTREGMKIAKAKPWRRGESPSSTGARGSSDIRQDGRHAGPAWPTTDAPVVSGRKLSSTAQGRPRACLDQTTEKGLEDEDRNGGQGQCWRRSCGSVGARRSPGDTDGARRW